MLPNRVPHDETPEVKEEIAQSNKEEMEQEESECMHICIFKKSILRN